MNIERKPLVAEYKVNQIGHYKELVAGAGSKVFKVNSAGVFVGASSFANAPFRVDYNGNFVASSATISGNSTFRGTIYAEAGAIEGDLVVSGSLYSDTGGYRTRLKDGKVEFLYNNTRRAYIMASDSGTGIQISSSSNIYLTKNSGEPIWTLDQSGNMVIGNTLAYIQWGNGRKITGTNSSLEIDGDLSPDTAWGHDCGTAAKHWNNVRGGDVHATGKFVHNGTNGITSLDKGFITSVRINSDRLQAKYRDLSFRGGICTEVGDESGWVTMDNDGSMNG